MKIKFLFEKQMPSKPFGRKHGERRCDWCEEQACEWFGGVLAPKNNKGFDFTADGRVIEVKSTIKNIIDGRMSMMKGRKGNQLKAKGIYDAYDAFMRELKADFIAVLIEDKIAKFYFIEHNEVAQCKNWTFKVGQ